MERMDITVCYQPVFIGDKVEKLRYKVCKGFPTEETINEIAEDPSIQHKVYEIDACNTPDGLAPGIDTIRQVFYSCLMLEFFFQGTIFKSFEESINKLGFEIKEYK